MTYRRRAPRSGVYRRVVSATYPGDTRLWDLVYVRLVLDCGHTVQRRAEVERLPGYVRAPPRGVWCEYCGADRIGAEIRARTPAHVMRDDETGP